MEKTKGKIDLSLLLHLLFFNLASNNENNDNLDFFGKDFHKSHKAGFFFVRPLYQNVFCYLHIAIMITMKTKWIAI